MNITPDKHPPGRYPFKESAELRFSTALNLQST
jgi:hypothetical protein